MSSRTLAGEHLLMAHSISKGLTVLVLALFIGVHCGCATGGGPGQGGRGKDEALSATPPRMAGSLGVAAENFFPVMHPSKDGPLSMTRNQIPAPYMSMVCTL